MTAPNADATIAARHLSALDAVVQIGVASSRVIAVSFPGSVSSDAATDHPLMDRIAAYADGERDEFDDVTVAFTLPNDQRAVLEALRDVPYGERVAPDTLANAAAGVDGDRETVLNALAANPAPIFVPDHRVRGAVGATPTRIASTLRAVEGID